MLKVVREEEYEKRKANYRCEVGRETESKRRKFIHASLMLSLQSVVHVPKKLSTIIRDEARRTKESIPYSIAMKRFTRAEYLW